MTLEACFVSLFNTVCRTGRYVMLNPALQIWEKGTSSLEVLEKQL